MNCRSKNILYPIGYLSAIGAAVLVVQNHQRIPFPLCPFKLLTGLPCPGCGGIRAANALLHGNILGAIYTNPLSCVVILCIAILPLLYLYDNIAGKHLTRSLLMRTWNRWTTLTFAIVIISNWIWNIYKDL